MPRVTVIEAEAMIRDDLDAMRREYTRMRDIAQKRVARLQKSFSETVAAKQRYITGYDANGAPIYKMGFQTLKNLDKMSLNNFAKAFSELSKFLNAKGSTIKGQREMEQKTTASLNEAIGTEDEQGNPVMPVNPGNYWRVIKILNAARSQKLVYGSDKMVELADATLALSKDQFDVILDNLETALSHSDTIDVSLAVYMEKHDIKSYQMVDMDDFIQMLGR